MKPKNKEPIHIENTMKEFRKILRKGGTGYWDIKFDELEEETTDFLQKALEDIYQKGWDDAFKKTVATDLEYMSKLEVYLQGKEDGVRGFGKQFAKGIKETTETVGIDVVPMTAENVLDEAEQYLSEQEGK